MEPPTTNPGTIPASSQVSWETAFWTLVPLAVNVMAQPCGRILGRDTRYWTYLRCLPIMCAADSLSIIVRLGIYGSGFLAKRGVRLPFWESLKLVIHHRFHDENEDEDAEGIRAMGRTTWLRWLFFIFGTLTPAIKLLAFVGTPWTKAWGTMFLVSFILVEALVVLSWWGGRQGSPLHDPGIELELNSIEVRLDAIDKTLYFGALTAHSLVLFWLVLDLWPDTDNVIRHYLLYFIHTTWAQTVVGKLYFSVGKLIVLSLLLLCMFSTFSALEVISIILVWLCFCIALSWETKIPVSMILNRMLVVDFGYFIGLFVVPIIFFFVLENICSKYPSVGEHFSSRKIDTESVNTVGRSEGVLIFVSFLYTVVLCICWYAFRYNPAGTVNPGWTSVFG
ncbi:hypothetical protein NA56DRAFT_649275 [Hyaloscypha hepaticicola]|uniref:Uncharacterized protein n=1 Tax=Hyaloscypha hepaticicola TaxID=2082293 RepID=A0A2J6PRQ9_9HELO|nr:hypothetical protein NA56DRAFT_649275 [Hyaloscypha hepaticicola]